MRAESRTERILKAALEEAEWTSQTETIASKAAPI